MLLREKTFAELHIHVVISLRLHKTYQEFKKRLSHDIHIEVQSTDNSVNLIYFTSHLKK